MKSIRPINKLDEVDNLLCTKKRKKKKSKKKDKKKRKNFKPYKNTYFKNNKFLNNETISKIINVISDYLIAKKS